MGRFKLPKTLSNSLDFNASIVLMVDNICQLMLNSGSFYEIMRGEIVEFEVNIGVTSNQVVFKVKSLLRLQIPPFEVKN